MDYGHVNLKVDIERADVDENDDMRDDLNGNTDIVFWRQQKDEKGSYR